MRKTSHCQQRYIDCSTLSSPAPGQPVICYCCCSLITAPESLCRLQPAKHPPQQCHVNQAAAPGRQCAPAPTPSSLLGPMTALHRCSGSLEASTSASHHQNQAFPSLIRNSTNRPQCSAPSQHLTGGAGTGSEIKAPETEGLGRRRSLSAPSLASAAEEQQPQPYSAIAAGSSSKKPAGHSRRSSSVDRSQPKQQHGQHSTRTTHQLHQPTPQQQRQQQGAVTGLQLLQECHPWCEAVVLHEVLQAVGGDVAAALGALQQMLPVPAADGTATAGPGSSCSDGSCSDTSTEQAPGVTTSSSTAAGSSLRQNWPAGPADAPVEDAVARLHQLRVQDNSSQPQQQQQRQVAGVEDTYRLLRGDAVKLSHKYRRATKRCAWNAWDCSHGKAWD